MSYNTGPVAFLGDTHEGNTTIVDYPNTKARAFGHYRIAREVVDASPVATIQIGDHAAFSPSTASQAAANTLYAQSRSLGAFSPIYACAPWYEVMGNHEEEMENITVSTARDFNRTARKLFFPNPTDETHESYYTFHIGATQYVVLDVYRGTTGAGDGLYPTLVTDWSFGATQLAWLWKTLRDSTASNIIVITHHLPGGSYIGVAPTSVPISTPGGVAAAYGRGGMNDILNLSAEHRTIHDWFLRFGVTCVIMGHDHAWAHGCIQGVHYMHIGSTVRPFNSTGTGFAACYGNVFQNGTNKSGIIAYKNFCGWMRMDESSAGLRFRWIKSWHDFPASSTFSWTTWAGRDPVPSYLDGHYGERQAVQASGGNYYVTVPVATKSIFGIYKASEVEAITTTSVIPAVDLYTGADAANVFDITLSSGQIQLNADPGEAYVYVDYAPMTMYDVTLRRSGGARTLSAAAPIGRTPVWQP